jgi:hypothetical protein
VRATPARYDAAVLGLVALVAVSLPRGLAVEWAAPPECPSAAEVRARLEQALADAPAGPHRGVHGRLTRLGELGWRLEISVHEAKAEPASQPPIEAGDCADLAAEFVSRTQTLWSLWTRPRKAPPPRKMSGRVRIAGRYGYGLLHQEEFGGGQVVFALAWRHARIEAGLAADAALAVDLDVKIRSHWLRTGLLVRGCGTLVARRVLDLHLCAGVEVGPMGGKNAEKRKWGDFNPTLDVHATPALTWWFHRQIGLWAGLGAGVFVLQPTPGKPGRELLPPSRYSLEIGAGLEFRWDR